MGYLAETVELFLFDALYLAILLSAVPLLSSMLVGVCISVLQAATQIQEQTLSFVPKLCIVCAVLYFFGPWLASEFNQFAASAFQKAALANLR